MEEKNAWEAMFSLVPPTGVDLDKAEATLMGKGEVDPRIKLKPEIERRTNEFLMDPTGFLSANASDPRVPRWTRLATGLGVSVAGTSPAEAAPPPKRTLSASALMSASVGDGTPTAPVLGTGKAGEASTDGEPRLIDKEKKRSRDRGDGAPSDKGRTSVAEETPTPDIPPADSTPGLVPAFQYIQDRGRVDGELVRERTAATRRETPAAQKRRLDAEAAERRRRLDEDAAERQRRMAEEEEALRRRLAIEAEADEKKRLAELRLAAEKQRLDEEAEVRREERKRARERKPPEPPLDRNLPPLGMTVIQSPKYIEFRDRLMTAVQSERRGETGAEDEVRKLGREITRLAGSSNRLEELAGGMLHRMRRSLAEWQDVHDPKAFQASYITGIYPD